MTYIGEAIKRERVAAGLTNKQLAERVGLSQQYVGDVQRGLRIPSVETMCLFSNQFPESADVAEWAWLLLRDLWGEPVATVMWKYATRVKTAVEGSSGQIEAPGDPGGSDGRERW